MELIEWILQDRNIDEAIKAVKLNKGAAGIDGMPADELDAYFALHKEEIKAQIREGKYKPGPVRRAYIPKADGKKRALGIPPTESYSRRQHRYCHWDMTNTSVIAVTASDRTEIATEQSAEHSNISNEGEGEGYADKNLDNKEAPKGV